MRSNPTRAARAGRPITGRWWVLLLLIAGPALLTISIAPNASAHATVASSDPADGERLAAAPNQVTVTFDESVGLDLGYLKVISADGTDVGQGPASHLNGQGPVIRIGLKPGLGDGTYIVSWRVISADSHPVEGSIRFLVGNGVLSTAPAPTESVVATSTSIVFDAARTAGYGSLAVLGGGWLLLTVWPGGRSDRRARRVLIIGWLVAVVAAIAETLVQGAYAGGTGLNGVLQLRLLTDTLGTNYGRLHLLRILLLAWLGGVLDGVLSARAAAPTIRRTVPTGLLFLGVVFTFSDSGHAGVAKPGWLALGSDMAHLTAMSAWIGGLVLLVVALLARREHDELRTVLPVFSRVAFVSVLVIAVTGTYQAWRESGTVRAITTTTYGRLVLIKVALFIGLILLGNLSRLAIQRRYVRRLVPVGTGSMAGADVVDPADGMDGELPVDTRRMRRSVLVELLLAAMVLSVTGVLVAQPPGRTAVVLPAPPPASATAALGAGRSVTVTVDPARHGTVSVDLTLHGAAVPQRIVVTASLTAQQLGPLPVSLTGPIAAAGTLTYRADDVLLPAAGQWTFDIAVTASEFDAVTTDVSIPVS